MVKTRQEAKIDSLSNRMLSAIQQRIVEHQARLHSAEERIPILIDRHLMAEQHHLQLIEEKTKALDPSLLLARGYSITLYQGKAVKDMSTLQPGDEIETRLAKGIIHSKVITS